MPVGDATPIVISNHRLAPQGQPRSDGKPALQEPQTSPSAPSDLSASGVYGIELPVQENGLVGEIELKPAPVEATPITPGVVKPVGTGPTDAELAKGVLPTASELRQHIGADPKSDIQFGLLRHKMSTQYKDVLAKLDAVHDTLARSTTVAAHEGPQTSAMIGRELDAVLARLQDLDDSLQAYGDARRTSHKPEMAALQQAVQHEMALLRGLQQQLDGGTPWPAELSVQTAVLYLRANEQLPLQQMGVAAQGGLSESDVAAYAKARIAITPDTLPGGATATSELTPLGSGAISVVDTADFILADGRPMKGVFKPEPDVQLGAVQAAVASGIPSEAPAFSARTVATARLDKALGLGLVPHSEFHLKGGPSKELGTLSAFASGQPPLLKGNFLLPLDDAQAQQLREHPERLEQLRVDHGWIGAELDPEKNILKVINTTKEIDRTTGEAYEGTKQEVRVLMDLRDPTLRKELVRLQIFDALTGQVDRTAQNYFVHRSEQDGKLHVIAIDNDMSFGKDAVSADFIVTGSRDFHGATLPEVIDRDTFDAVMGMTAADIDRELGTLLSADEVKATQLRLADIQRHLGSLGPDQVYDRDEQWTSEEADRRLGIPDLTMLQSQVGEQHLIATAQGTPRIPVLDMKVVNLTLDQAASQSYVARETVSQFLATTFKTGPIVKLEQFN